MRLQFVVLLEGKEKVRAILPDKKLSVLLSMLQERFEKQGATLFQDWINVCVEQYRLSKEVEGFGGNDAA